MQGVLHVLQHSLQAAETGSPSPFQHLARALDRNRASGDAAHLVAELSPQKPCPACVFAADMDRQLADSLLARLDGPEGLLEPYRRSGGLCLVHFRDVIVRAAPGAQLRQLIDAQVAVWEQLDGELSEFIRKNDHRFHGETFGLEEDSWQRALAIISGPAPVKPGEGRGLTQSRHGRTGS